MKMLIDTVNKTITIEEDINLHDFHEEINKLLPGGEWREYTLKITKVVEWRDNNRTNPITQPWTNPLTPVQTPWTNPVNPIWYGNDTNITSATDDVFVSINNNEIN